MSKTRLWLIIVLALANENAGLHRDALASIEKIVALRPEFEPEHHLFMFPVLERMEAGATLTSLLEENRLRREGR